MVKILDKLSIYEFGEQLLTTNDLDPIYVLLHEAQWERPKLLKFLLGYWCYYNIGTASWIVNQTLGPVNGRAGGIAYWNAMNMAIDSKYPRSRERRHFRGDNAVKSVSFLQQAGIDWLFKPLLDKSLSLQEVINWIGSWVGFGPWISFKVADMLDRLGLANVSFDNSSALMIYKSPAEGAESMWAIENEDEKENMPANVLHWALESISGILGHIKAPPRYERTINIQEIETILCKWHSYMNGHYILGEDITGARESLLRFAKCKTSQQLIQAGKRGGLW